MLRYDEHVVVSELGARFLPLINGERTLDEIAKIVKNDILADPEALISVHKNENDQGRTFESFLVEESLILIRDFIKLRAITFEPTTT